MRYRFKEQIKKLVWFSTLFLACFGLISQTASGNSLSQSNSALEIFRHAYESRYTWNSQFPGYTSKVELKDNEKAYTGTIQITPDLDVKVTEIEPKEESQIVDDSLQMMVIHRRQVPFSQEHKNSTFQIGTTNKNGSIEIVETSGNTKSRYKVFQNQLVQVNRFLGDTAVTVDVLNSEKTPTGYIATHYRTVFRQPQTKEVVGVEDSEDTFTKIGDYYLLTHQLIHDYEGGKLTHTVELNFPEIRLNK